jgi:hypothetical protein
VDPQLVSSILNLVLINDDLRVIVHAARLRAPQTPGSMPVMMMMSPSPPAIPYPTKSSLSSKLLLGGKSASGKAADSKSFGSIDSAKTSKCKDLDSPFDSHDSSPWKGYDKDDGVKDEGSFARHSTPRLTLSKVGTLSNTWGHCQF